MPCMNLLRPVACAEMVGCGGRLLGDGGGVDPQPIIQRLFLHLSYLIVFLHNLLILTRRLSHILNF